jgi:hypothetical protein
VLAQGVFDRFEQRIGKSLIFVVEGDQPWNVEHSIEHLPPLGPPWNPLHKVIKQQIRPLHPVSTKVNPRAAVEICAFQFALERGELDNGSALQE